MHAGCTETSRELLCAIIDQPPKDFQKRPSPNEEAFRPSIRTTQWQDSYADQPWERPGNNYSWFDDFPSHSGVFSKNFASSACVWLFFALYRGIFGKMGLERTATLWADVDRVAVNKWCSKFENFENESTRKENKGFCGGFSKNRDHSDPKNPGANFPVLLLLLRKDSFEAGSVMSSCAVNSVKSCMNYRPLYFFLRQTFIVLVNGEKQPKSYECGARGKSLNATLFFLMSRCYNLWFFVWRTRKFYALVWSLQLQLRRFPRNDSVRRQSASHIVMPSNIFSVRNSFCEYVYFDNGRDHFEQEHLLSFINKIIPFPSVFQTSVKLFFANDDVSPQPLHSKERQPLQMFVLTRNVQSQVLLQTILNMWKFLC